MLSVIVYRKTSGILADMKHILPLFLVAVFFVRCTGQQSPIVNESSKAMSKNPYYSNTDTTAVQVSNEEWKKILDPEVYRVAREAGTERAFTGKFYDFEGVGTYSCAVCGNLLFKSDSKFSSGCGWPSFFQPIRTNSCTYKRDTSYGMVRTEVNCGRCGSHLGHVFDDGPPPTGLRYCMNSIVLDFEPDK